MGRRQRRLHATPPQKTATNAHTIATTSESPRSHAPPAASSSISKKSKSLCEIAAERQADFSQYIGPILQSANQAEPAIVPDGTKLITLTADGKISDQALSIDQSDSGLKVNGSSDVSSLPPLLDTLFLSASLSCLHFTLSFLTYHQYAQRENLSIQSLLKQTVLIALPTWTLLIHVSHGHLTPLLIRTSQSPWLRVVGQIGQHIAFVVTANIAGCYLIYLTNDQGYFAVMKKAPAIGTLWVWSIIELGILGALLGVVGPAVFAWWNEYGVI